MIWLSNYLKLKLLDVVMKTMNESEDKKMLEKLQEIIAEQLGIEAAEVQADSNFKDDLNADSLDLFEMVMAMEEEFGVEIPSEDLDKIATVQDVMDYLKNKGVEE